MKIDHNAPLVARREVFIDAPIEAVWRILSDILRWPAWQPDITTIRLEGEPRSGVAFRWRVGGSEIRSTLRAYEPPRHIGWESLSPGMTALHIYTLERHGQRTRVVTEESRSGWSARLLSLTTPHLVEPLLEATLAQLKQTVEVEGASS